MTTQPPAAAGRLRFWRRLLVFGKWIIEREEVPRGHEQRSLQRLRSSPLAWLTSPDLLPNRACSGLSRLGFLPWLASRDRLPDHLEAPLHEPGFLGWVTAREDLPAVSTEQTPVPRSLFRWLLTSEAHDRLESLHSTKEVPPHES